MTGWTPLFQQIIGSSIWEAPDHVRIAWITMLASADRNGIVPITVSGLKRLANISLENAHNAIEVLSSPDNDTLTQEFDGRRIERCAGGWKILNFEKYRDKAKQSVIREQNRLAQQKLRDEIKEIEDREEIVSMAHVDVVKVLEHLNALSGSKFQFTKKTVLKISERLKEVKGDVAGVMDMIARQCAKWKTDLKMAEYLRPKTLFAEENFHNYYAARDQPVVEIGAGGKPKGKYSHIGGEWENKKNGAF
jgi:uncharacterized phage protein (TIGR02220 family)